MQSTVNILEAVRVAGVVIAVQLKDKVIVIPPQALAHVSLEDIALGLVYTGMADEDVVAVLEKIDGTRNTNMVQE